MSADEADGEERTAGGPRRRGPRRAGARRLGAAAPASASSGRRAGGRARRRRRRARSPALERVRGSLARVRGPLRSGRRRGRGPPARRRERLGSWEIKLRRLTGKQTPPQQVCKIEARSRWRGARCAPRAGSAPPLGAEPLRGKRRRGQKAGPRTSKYVCTGTWFILGRLRGRESFRPAVAGKVVGPGPASRRRGRAPRRGPRRGRPRERRAELWLRRGRAKRLGRSAGGVRGRRRLLGNSGGRRPRPAPRPAPRGRAGGRRGCAATRARSGWLQDPEEANLPPLGRGRAARARGAALRALPPRAQRPGGRRAPPRSRALRASFLPLAAALRLPLPPTQRRPPRRRRSASPRWSGSRRAFPPRHRPPRSRAVRAPAGGRRRRTKRPRRRPA